MCFCCWHSPIQDMNVRVFLVHVMKCMCGQTRPQFTLSPARDVGNGISTDVDSMRKNPQLDSSKEGQTHDAASCRIASPAVLLQPHVHYERCLVLQVLDDSVGWAFDCSTCSNMFCLRCFQH